MFSVRLASVLLVAAARRCDALAFGSTPGSTARDHPHRALAMLALSASEQYAAQQAELRQRRQARLEAEAAAASGEEPSEVARRTAEQAEREAFEQRFGEQLAVFNSALFPPDQYSARNSESRKDGYWPFMGKGEEPPLDFTYGEFPLPLFAKLVDRACELRGIGDERTSTVLADLGSGAGRLALWAAATSSWRRVVGVEYLPSLAATATAKLDQARSAFPALLQTSDVQLVQGSWDEPLALFADIDVSPPNRRPRTLALAIRGAVPRGAYTASAPPRSPSLPSPALSAPLRAGGFRLHHGHHRKRRRRPRRPLGRPRSPVEAGLPRGDDGLHPRPERL